MKLNSFKSLLYFLFIFQFMFPASFLRASVKDTLLINEGLALPMARGTTETILLTNTIEAALALGTWSVPKEGDEVLQQDGKKYAWSRVKAGSQGWFNFPTRGVNYLYTTLEMEKDTVLIISLQGNDMVYINGAARTGNVYGTSDSYAAWEKDWNFVTIPVKLKKGKNEFIFRVSRGKMKAKLYAPSSLCQLIPNDLTLPDFLIEEEPAMPGAIEIINSTAYPRTDLVLEVIDMNGSCRTSTIPVIQPFSVRKCAFLFPEYLYKEKGEVPVKLQLSRKTGNRLELLDEVSIQIRVMDKSENHKETFLSKIDGSVQYYSVNPPRNYDWKSPTALIFSVHGASVEAINQSGSYYPKTWGMIVSPTNRRPYGYNWEDWGRMDALEVLEIATSKFPIDKSKVYLTGHSMGGHGTWHLGAMYPDRFAAIGPSAGWISFWSYRFKDVNLNDSTPVKKMIRRPTSPSETPLFAENYKQLGVYVIHGEDDDNVLIDQAKMMVNRLEEIGHKDYQFHYQPKAGHWWDESDEPGADCVDWPPMFDFFTRHTIPANDQVLNINFLTSNPGVSSRNHWLLIDAQTEQLSMSEAHLKVEPGQGKFSGTTLNIARLALDLDIVSGKEKIWIELDKTKAFEVIVKPGQKQLWLELSKGKWNVVGEPDRSMKNANRYGTFKDVFKNRMVFVYGTQGNAEENTWAFDKARYDAERFWYQGNGSIEVVADTDFDTLAFAGRNIILFGNRDTNKAWDLLLYNSPVQVTKESVKVNDEIYKGNDLACLFVRPRNGDEISLVGVVSGTGLTGMRICTRLPYLSPGIGLPDCTVLNARVMTGGEEGVILTGFFGLDWSVEKGEFAGKN